MHDMAVGDKLAIKGPIPKFDYKGPCVFDSFRARAADIVSPQSTSLTRLASGMCVHSISRVIPPHLCHPLGHELPAFAHERAAMCRHAGVRTRTMRARPQLAVALSAPVALLESTSMPSCRRRTSGRARLSCASFRPRPRPRREMRRASPLAPSHSPCSSRTLRAVSTRVARDRPWFGRGRMQPRLAGGWWRRDESACECSQRRDHPICSRLVPSAIVRRTTGWTHLSMSCGYSSDTAR